MPRQQGKALGSFTEVDPHAEPVKPHAWCTNDAQMLAAGRSHMAPMAGRRGEPSPRAVWMTFGSAL